MMLREHGQSRALCASHVGHGRPRPYSLRRGDGQYWHQLARPLLFPGVPEGARHRAFTWIRQCAAAPPATWLLAASRPLKKADGSFDGIIVAAVEPPYFNSLWRTMELGDGGSIALATRSGVLMMRTPLIDEVMGKNLRRPPCFQGHVAPQPHRRLCGRQRGGRCSAPFCLPNAETVPRLCGRRRPVQRLCSGAMAQLGNGCGTHLAGCSPNHHCCCPSCWTGPGASVNVHGSSPSKQRSG